jgi:hypothetical protein
MSQVALATLLVGGLLDLRGGDDAALALLVAHLLLEAATPHASRRLRAATPLPLAQCRGLYSSTGGQSRPTLPPGNRASGPPAHRGISVAPQPRPNWT